MRKQVPGDDVPVVVAAAVVGPVIVVFVSLIPEEVWGGIGSCRIVRQQETHVPFRPFPGGVLFSSPSSRVERESIRMAKWPRNDSSQRQDGGSGSFSREIVRPSATKTLLNSIE
jgi:hypothetical protein